MRRTRYSSLLRSASLTQRRLAKKALAESSYILAKSCLQPRLSSISAFALFPTAHFSIDSRSTSFLILTKRAQRERAVLFRFYGRLSSLSSLSPPFASSTQKSRNRSDSLLSYFAKFQIARYVATSRPIKLDKDTSTMFYKIDSISMHRRNSLRQSPPYIITKHLLQLVQDLLRSLQS